MKSRHDYVELLRSQYKNRIEVLETFNSTSPDISASIDAQNVGNVVLSRLQTNFGYVAHNPEISAFEETLCFTFLEEGGAVAAQNGQIEQLSRDNVLIYSNIRNANWQFRSAFSEFVIQIPMSIVARQFPAAEKLIGRTYPRSSNTQTLLQFLKSYLSLSSAQNCSEQTRRTVSTMFESLLFLEVDSFCKSHDLHVDADAQKEALGFRIRSFILSHLDDYELTAEKIARANHISVRTLYDVFSLQGIPVMEFLWKARLNQARKELTDFRLANVSVSEIAFRCGFKSPSHFSKRFRQAFGATPMELRAASLAAPSQSWSVDSPVADRL